MAHVSEILEKRKAPGAKHGSYYTNYYTNALRKRLFHSCNGAILHIRQDVRVPVQSDGYARVAQHLRNNLPVHVLKE